MFLCHKKIPFVGPDMEWAIFSFLYLEWNIIFISKCVQNWKVVKTIWKFCYFLKLIKKQIVSFFWPKIWKWPIPNQAQKWRYNNSHCYCIKNIVFFTILVAIVLNFCECAKNDILHRFYKNSKTNLGVFLSGLWDPWGYIISW